MKRKHSWLLASLVPLIAFALSPPVFAGSPAGPKSDIARWFTLQTVVNTGPAGIDRTVADSPPKPPDNIFRPAVELTGTDALVTIPVPTYNWCFGSGCTAGAMIAAYYDRWSHPNMYTGPTNGGVMPMDNSVWPAWVDTNGDSRAQCPLAATHNGLDGRVTDGHVDDYWLYINQTGPDPYVDGNWTEHVIGDCTGDYMKSNKWIASQNQNADGGTTFYLFTDGSRTLDTDLEDNGVHIYDGGYGLKLFYESRGYTVARMYNQHIRGYNGNSRGFRYNRYCSEIDDGRPMLLHLEGHIVVGVGYDDTSGQLVYINDTWDFSTHTMTWGGSYAGYTHSGVTLIELSEPTLIELTSFDAKAGADQVRLEWETATEQDNAGFHLWRSETKDGEFKRINRELIPARGGGTWGALYEFRDDRVVSRWTYHYKLEDVDFAGNSSFHGPVSARVRPPGGVSRNARD